MPAGEHRNQHLLDHVALPDDHLRQLGPYPRVRLLAPLDRGNVVWFPRFVQHDFSGCHKSPMALSGRLIFRTASSRLAKRLLTTSTILPISKIGRKTAHSTGSNATCCRLAAPAAAWAPVAPSQNSPKPIHSPIVVRRG